MTKRAVLLILLGVLCASAALAAPKNTPKDNGLVLTLNGKYAGGSFNADIELTEGTGTVNLYELQPIPSPDGTGWVYYADIGWNDGAYHEVWGLVPGSAVTSASPWGPLHVNITYDSFFATGVDPSGDIELFTSLEGTFTIYTGRGSDNMTQTGTQTEVQTHCDGSTDTLAFKGVNTHQDATFDGTFETTTGTYDVSVEGPHPHATMWVQAGTLTLPADFF